MKGLSKFAISLVVVGVALLVPASAGATLGSSPIEACTDPTGTYTFTVTITLAQDGTPIATPATNKNGTCVDGGDIIAFVLPAGATNWSASFPTPTAGSLFQNNCTFGNGTGESSSCTVVNSPSSATYSYSVTVNGKTLDPHVIIKGGARRRHHRRHHKPKPAVPTQP
ncbi:MAG TPA: hypothetical protein VGW33_09720 [Terriglobia bacterium]|nr:hypothetical protein [Terriglobia bacterium]